MSKVKELLRNFPDTAIGQAISQAYDVERAGYDETIRAQAADLELLRKNAKKHTSEGTSPTRTRITRAAQHLPINLSPDLERIIELAHAQDPKQTERLLSYMGLSLVAGTLRDRASASVTLAGAGLEPEQGSLFLEQQ